MNPGLAEILLHLLSGAGGLLVGFAGGWSAYFWKTREQRAEFDNWRRQREETKARHTEYLERVDKGVDILVKLKQHDVPTEQLEEAMDRLFTPPDEAVEYLPLDRSPQEVIALLDHHRMLQGYWAMIEARELHRTSGKYDADQMKVLDNLVNKYRERFTDNPDEATPEDKSRSMHTMLLLMWLTGAEVRLLDEDDAEYVTFDKLVAEKDEDPEGGYQT
jgi:hypothetical protein